MAAKHIALFAGLLLPALALAQSAGPLPPRPSSVRVLSAADHELFTKALAAAAKGDWPGALALGDQAKDTSARQLLQWRYALDQKSGAKFAEIDAVIKVA